MKNTLRQDRTESAYRGLVRERLLELLKVLDPKDFIHYSKLNYPELVVYAFDWLTTERDEVALEPATTRPLEL